MAGPSWYEYALERVLSCLLMLELSDCMVTLVITLLSYTPFSVTGSLFYISVYIFLTCYLSH